jgi:hypothetical protein
MEMSDEDRERAEKLRRSVFEAVATRAMGGATLKDVMEDNIQVIWPGSRVRATQKMVEAALSYLVDEEHISKKGNTYMWIEASNRGMGEPKDAKDATSREAPAAYSVLPSAAATYAFLLP